MALPAYLLTYLLTHLLVPEPVTARVPTHYLLTTYSLSNYLLTYLPICSLLRRTRGLSSA